MFNWLHSYQPSSIIIEFYGLTFYWYGLIIAISILAGLSVAVYLSKYFNLKKDDVYDLSLYLVLFSLIGARIYEVFLEWPYYQNNILSIFQLWEGGLAIHGAIVAGFITIYIFAKKRKLNFWNLVLVSIPALALGQSLGRWGNWFNQELFGLPSKLSWAIPISLENRPYQYLQFEYFHPTFLYESLGNLIIFFILLFLIFKFKSVFVNKKLAQIILASYLSLYSILRFSLEFIKIDKAPEVFGWRWPQIFSLILIGMSLYIYYQAFKIKRSNS
jgi:phosphatidylglycerol---prolipoprotein diacylglyceryl transferase